ncbi:hypothetical protein EP7_005614 (plasmid) [Isosphaeraceae bacterium EP7]
MAERRPGLAPLPASLLRPTTQPEPAQDDQAEDDGQESQDGQGGAPETKPAVKRTRTRRPVVSTVTKGRKIHLPDDVHDRLQLMAFQKRSTISAVAAEILDRNLPRFRVEREG